MGQKKGYIPLFLWLCLLFSCKSSEPFSKKDVKHAQKVIGLNFDDQYLDDIHRYLLRNKAGYDRMRQTKISHHSWPTNLFNPLPIGEEPPRDQTDCEWKEEVVVERPEELEDLAFASISQLASLISNGKVTSEELTRMFIARIKKYDSTLKSVITLIEDDAIRTAKQRDEELKNGRNRGVLHGIPYGVKDLVAVANHPTTWGAEPFKSQILNETATLVEKLDAAGAVLIAKLSSGSLARGDVWFDGQTKNPWDTTQGASGSSAGSGSATAAGLVSFAIGTETLGSITSPSHRNGIAGLRPTYGRVSREGVMSLSWSMDKVGPMCRSAADCAIVFKTIQGFDPEDPTTYKNVGFCFEEKPMTQLKIGVLENLIESDTTDGGNNMRKTIKLLREKGVTLIPDSLPDNHPFEVFDIILRAEAGAFFDTLVLSGAIDNMVQQGYRSRANSLRQSRFITAVEYIQASRYRGKLIQDMHQLLKKYDVLITPTFGGTQLLITNLTGHPVITVPNGFDKRGRPTSISFLGNLFDEASILAFAKAFQDMSDHHKKHPGMVLR